jgi:hypothetical protein
MNSGTIWVRFVEKTRGQKSRATVPLRMADILDGKCGGVGGEGGGWWHEADKMLLKKGIELM